MTFGQQLKRERLRLGLSQTAAAQLIDIPFRTFWDWEQDKVKVPAVAQEGALARMQAQPSYAGEEA